MAKALLMVVVLLLAVVGRSSAELSAEEQKKCENEVGKLVSCLQYAEKSTSEPTTDCCKSVSDIRNADAACLCYLLAASLRGDSGFKSLNIDGSRMLQLPTVCKTPNANITECPTLLKLSPGSPDYGLFNNSGTPGASSKGSTTTGGGSPSSDAYMLQVPFSSFAIYAVFVAVFFIIFPTWP